MPATPGPSSSSLKVPSGEVPGSARQKPRERARLATREAGSLASAHPMHEAFPQHLPVSGPADASRDASLDREPLLHRDTHPIPSFAGVPDMRYRLTGTDRQGTHVPKDRDKALTLSPSRCGTF